MTRSRISEGQVACTLCRAGANAPGRRMRVGWPKRQSLHRGPVPQAPAANQALGHGLVRDQLPDGWRFRVLTVIDQWCPESPSGRPGVAFAGATGAAGLAAVARRRLLPMTIVVDHGTESAGARDEWASQAGVQPD